TWSIARSGDASVSSKEIADAMQELSDCPGLARLEPVRENARYREKPPPQETVAAFANAQPRTLQGRAPPARAKLAGGERKDANALVSRLWREQVLHDTQERLVLDEFGSLLSAEDHRFRLERMLYAERIDAARRIARLVSAEKLVDAWAAVSRNAAS